MYLAKRSHWNPLDAFSELEEFLTPAASSKLAAPHIDMREDENGYVIKADLPGIQKEDLELSVAENVLTVKGQRKEEKEKSEKGWYYSERWSGSFERQIAFPSEVDAAKVTASFKDGVLEISVPRSERTKPRQINVDVK